MTRNYYATTKTWSFQGTGATEVKLAPNMWAKLTPGMIAAIMTQSPPREVNRAIGACAAKKATPEQQRIAQQWIEQRITELGFSQEQEEGSAHYKALRATPTQVNDDLPF